MHGFDKLSKETQQKIQKQVMPLYGVQLLMTVFTSVVLSLFIAPATSLLITNLPSDWNAYGMAFFFWLGFSLPAITSAAMFGGSPEGWVIKKIAIQAGFSLVALQLAAFILKTL